ncbi:MAG TPA: 16S rRNA (cytosine(967)-C(5))-methyltransferase RsmB [Candidatus Polarisedimenticolia bacterium]|nr:16S rRNA (cytosine(967)-C(5))-methyltransferase RsmB [Candidatus Polarisedimenticolia bacterium]
MRRKRSDAAADPRSLACEILDNLERAGSRASEELARLGDRLADDRDMRLATELVYGTLRRRSGLDYHLVRLSGRDLERIDPALLAPLRVALYQILHLDRVPASAAVNESVEIARRRLGERSAGFVNAVLRKAARDRPALRLPEEGDDPDGFMALSYSLPRWMIERWRERLGDEETCRLAASLVSPAPLSLWVNGSRTDAARLAEELAGEGIATAGSPLLPGSLRVLGGRPQKSRAFREGKFYLQDEGSQAVVFLMQARPGEILADLCAAPGGKSFGLASLAGRSGRVLSIDRSLSRIRVLVENRDRLDLPQVMPVVADLEKPPPAGSSFAGVLLDAPCTGTGILRRQPEIRWRRSPADIVSLVLRQDALLETASRLVARGGRLVYSVCSLEPEEGEDRIAGFLSRHPDFAVRDPRASLPPEMVSAVASSGFLRTWPHRHGCDGFFAAVLQRQGAEAPSVC